jgi:hypothetical protein
VRAVGSIGWATFLTAASATMLCFAFLDPQSFLDGYAPSWWGPRMRVYAIRVFFFFFFFFFSFVGIAAATLAGLLARPRRRR